MVHLTVKRNNLTMMSRSYKRSETEETGSDKWSLRNAYLLVNSMETLSRYKFSMHVENSERRGVRLAKKFVTELERTKRPRRPINFGQRWHVTSF